MESLAADLSTMVRTPLEASHVDALRKVGTVKTYQPGDYLARLGDPIEMFFYVEDGEVEAGVEEHHELVEEEVLAEEEEDAHVEDQLGHRLHEPGQEGKVDGYPVPLTIKESEKLLMRFKLYALTSIAL